MAQSGLAAARGCQQLTMAAGNYRQSEVSSSPHGARGGKAVKSTTLIRRCNADILGKAISGGQPA